MPETISCIMPTRGRRGWVPLALRCWQEQDWPAFARELIVVDDGPEPVGDLCAGLPQVRYVHLGRDNSIGAKFNAGCELARGDVLAAWADDDYHAAHRLTYQYGALMESGAAVCGTDSLHYWDVLRQEAWLYEWAVGTRSNGYVTGGTMMWRRAFWEARRFDTLRASGEDTRWICGRGPLLGTLARDIYVATIHGRNTADKDLVMLEASAHWTRQAREVVEEIAPAWWLDGAREAAQ